jgi:hypothetical protein
MLSRSPFTSTAYAALTVICLWMMSSCQKPVSGADDVLPSKAERAMAATPAQPPFNLEVILRGADGAFGHVSFRQANDAEKLVTLDVWVRDLEPNHTYLLQRAVDTNLDGECTGTAWLTLGKGLTPGAIETDDKGRGKAALYRDLSAIATGTGFDINFRIVDATSMAVVLTSDCYRYVIR